MHNYSILVGSTNFVSIMLDFANEFAISVANDVFLPFQLFNGRNSLQNDPNWAHKVFFDMFYYHSYWKQCRIYLTPSKNKVSKFDPCYGTNYTK